MCGIAGMIDRAGRREFDPARLRRMADAIRHRGPDEDGYHLQPGVALASRRLSIVGLADGRQPIWNEDRSVVVVFNGELFDHKEKRALLEQRGHRFATHADTEILVHLWEEHGEGLLEHLRGQFAFALFDTRQRTLILARDRVGISPLHWAQRGDTIYFGSEIKAILASGEVAPEPDPLGLDHVFTYLGMATHRTAFKDIQSIPPGHYLRLHWAGPDAAATLDEKRYWDLDFPDAGTELDSDRPDRLIDEFQAIFTRAVEWRLRADVPVVAYLSGGVDSTTVAAAVTKVRGSSIPTFTIRIPSPGLDETERALVAAKAIGAEPTIVTVDAQAVSATYPKLVIAAESPVMDTSCAAIQLLAAEVHRQGFKVSLTGEGADEALAGYPWFKFNRLGSYFDWGPVQCTNVLRRLFLRLNAPHLPRDTVARAQALVGGTNATQDFYGFVSHGRWRYFTPEHRDRIGQYSPLSDMKLPTERMRRWDPLNRALYLGYKALLPGLLLNAKSDRVGMASSVENRYPFLDEEVISFCAKLHPRWKLRGIRRDKHLLRLMAARWLPREITQRPKAMFRAPFTDPFSAQAPAYIQQLLSEESLKKTGYFASPAVQQARQLAQAGKLRINAQMALANVTATQLWHHLFISGGLCDLPTWQPPA
jgi:asparagine synthase (glutamine-hydrolysing)